MQDVGVSQNVGHPFSDERTVITMMMELGSWQDVVLDQDGPGTFISCSLRLYCNAM